MRIRSLTPFLAVGAGAVAIALAPVASAAPTDDSVVPSCTSIGQIGRAHV